MKLSLRTLAIGGPAILTGLLVLCAATPVAAAEGASVTIDLGSGQGGLVPAIKLILLFAGLALAPTLILMMTSFTRIVVVLALLRQAVGVVQLPPSRVVIGLALFLTFFTMRPIFEEVNRVAIAPYEAGEMAEMEAVDAALGPMRGFMLRQTRAEDLELLLSVTRSPRPRTPDELSTMALIPAFLLSELKTAFQMGALLFLPFLVIDLVVASVLMSMGMMMLPPPTISLPLKLIVFVLVDGWGIVVRSLAQSFGG